MSIHASQDYSWGREHGLDLQIVDIHDCDSLFSPLGRGFNCIASSCAVLLVSRLEGFNCIASSCVCVFVWKLTAIPLRVMRFDSRLSTVRLVLTLRTSANC